MNAAEEYLRFVDLPLVKANNIRGASGHCSTAGGGRSRKVSEQEGTGAHTLHAHPEVTGWDRRGKKVMTYAE